MEEKLKTTQEDTNPTQNTPTARPVPEPVSASIAASKPSGKKKLLLIPVVLIVLAALGGGGAYLYKASQVKPEDVFRKYLTKTAQQKIYNVEESYSGAGTKSTNRATIEAGIGKFTYFSETSCDITVDNKPVSLTVSTQLENANLYGRMDKISGDVTNYQSGQVRSLATVYSKVLGKWYKANDHESIKAQLAANMFASDTGINAPRQDATKLVDAILNKGAITVDSNSRSGKNYTFKITAHKDKYLELLKEQFPALKSPDLVTDQLFAKESSVESTITIAADGTEVSEDAGQPNPCADTVSSFIGNSYTGLAQKVTGTSAPKQSISPITPITSSKPYSEMGKDLVL